MWYSWQNAFSLFDNLFIYEAKAELLLQMWWDHILHFKANCFSEALRKKIHNEKEPCFHNTCWHVQLESQIAHENK